ncbi:MAG: hypothetical protein RI988_3992 [Pseudomonadota bacterium]|jgi:Asp/Glu/hydantoin racemase
MQAPRRILLINPNTTAEVTALLVRHLSPLLPAGTSLQACTAAFGAPYIACEASHAVAAHAVLQAWAGQPERFDAVLIGCFGDPGLFALRESCPAPVTGLAEASFIEAAQGGPFAVVTGGVRWKPMLLRLAAALGFGQALVHVETVTPTGAQLRADPALARDTIGKACEVAAASGARRVIVGGAGLAGLAAALQAQCPLPLIDSVEAGLRVLLRGQAGHAACPPEEAVERLDLVRAYTNVGHILSSTP